jgi:hypothetical protein
MILLSVSIASCKPQAPTQQDSVEELRKLLINKTWQLTRLYDPYWRVIAPNDTNRGRVMNGSTTVFFNDGSAIVKDGSFTNTYKWRVYFVSQDSIAKYPDDIFLKKPVLWKLFPDTSRYNIPIEQMIERITSDTLILGQLGNHGIVTWTFLAR